MPRSLSSGAPAMPRPCHSRTLSSMPKERAMVHSRNETKLIETAKAFRAQILAQRERIEAGRRLPDDLVWELARAGFFRIYLRALRRARPQPARGDGSLGGARPRGCLGGMVRMEWEHLLDDGAVGKGDCPHCLR